MTNLCSEAELQDLILAMQSDRRDELVQADRLVSRYPDDARLHFLRGSVLVSIGRPIEAMPALQRAVELAPDFSIARFQLGFFQLTSGEAADALSTWGPLALLPEGHYLRYFVAGLTHLIRDEFEEAIRYLREGIAANEENPPLNNDMNLLIEQTSLLVQSKAADHEDPGFETATSFLLGQLSGHGRAH